MKQVERYFYPAPTPLSQVKLVVGERAVLERNVNFSQVLQDALRTLTDRPSPVRCKTKVPQTEAKRDGLAVSFLERRPSCPTMI